MSASTQNATYIFGREKQNAKRNIISKKEIERIRKDTDKYFPEKKK